MPDFKKKSKGFDMKSKKAKNKRPNYGVKNTGNFMNLEEYGYGPADNIDFQKGTGSIGDTVLPSDKNSKKKKSTFKLRSGNNPAFKQIGAVNYGLKQPKIDVKKKKSSKDNGGE